ncbi:PREDICTED: uncharacterized protein LOC105568766 isoform X2 [Vollenhovia emeryi]|uniref:uncharacterized protein LOC105568766 isoform X2 n=1 Tax=Vollenhovia emeryi TaxID=411798 RepID=UPI0005F51D58|nr:PREDICTED: uncharacterized protein LOC105568766 isoform X2 [Vollenhovia emeryi]
MEKYHFTNADLDRSSLISNVRLRENALPKQVNDYSMEIDDTVEEPCSERIEDFHNENDNLLLKDSEHNFDAGPPSNTLQMELKECVAESEQLKYSPLHQPSNELSDEINDKLECSSVSTPKTAYRLKPRTCTTPLPEDTPRKVFLKKVLRNSSLLYKQKIKNLQQQLRRRDTRIAQMETVLKALKQKNILGTEQLDVLKDLSKFNVHLLKRQISKVKNMPKERQYIVQN